MFPEGDTSSPKCRDLVFPDGDIAGPNSQHGLPTDWHSRLLTLLRAQVEQLLAIFH